MEEITQIRKLSLWIFFIPLIAINLCLFISINYDLLENTIFRVDQIGRTNFTIPYIDGSLSISRASRTYPAFLIFKPGMIITSILLYFYWKKNNVLVNKFNDISNKNYNYDFSTDSDDLDDLDDFNLENDTQNNNDQNDNYLNQIANDWLDETYLNW